MKKSLVFGFPLDLGRIQVLSETLPGKRRRLGGDVRLGVVTSRLGGSLGVDRLNRDQFRGTCLSLPVQNVSWLNSDDLLRGLIVSSVACSIASVGGSRNLRCRWSLRAGWSPSQSFVHQWVVLLTRPEKLPLTVRETAEGFCGNLDGKLERLIVDSGDAAVQLQEIFVRDDDFVPWVSSLLVPNEEAWLERRNDLGPSGPFLLEQLVGLIESDTVQDSETMHVRKRRPVFVKRLVRSFHVEHLLWVQDRVMMFRTSVDAANELAAVTSFFVMSVLQADHAESVLVKERLPVLSPEGPVLAVLREVEHRFADGASSLLALDLRLRMQLEIVGEVVLSPVPPAMKQRMMLKLATVIEAAFLRQFAVHGLVFRAEANFAGAQASDETLSFVDASDDKIVTNVEVVSRL